MEQRPRRRRRQQLLSPNSRRFTAAQHSRDTRARARARPHTLSKKLGFQRNDSIRDLILGAEQEAIVRSFEKIQAQQSFEWRVNQFFFHLVFLLPTFNLIPFHFVDFCLCVECIRCPQLLLCCISPLFHLSIDFLSLGSDGCDMLRSSNTFLLNSVTMHTSWRRLIHRSSYVQVCPFGCLLCISCPHYLIAVLACSMTIMELLKHGKQWIWYSCGVGTVLAVFWLNYMLRLPKFQWDIIWLPFGPLSGAGLSFYVEHLLAESSEEVQKLRGYMHAYKAR
ncbi:hypothetical protein RJ641_025976 [Dillenia turbinata]|uniref:Uncharacterized protein n=1 Tax=Dillenia turbinata TaxID=194707 RepID=A0AAN8W2H2_9MAGN